MKPTQEQMREWSLKAITHPEWKERGLDCMIEIAFAAGMESAAQVCEKIQAALDPLSVDLLPTVCANAIRKAKEES